MNVSRIVVTAVLAAAIASMVAGEGQAGGGAPISSCGQTATESAFLTADLSCPGSDGMIVGASGITIDLRGFAITGDDQTGIGIRNTGFDGVKVLNGAIRDFRFGIVIESDADKNVVDSVTIRSHKLDGLIVATGSDQLTLKNVRSLQNGADGISLTDSTGHKLSGVSTAGNQASGLELINAAGVSVSASTMTRNGTGGIRAEGASGDLSISKTTVAGNTSGSGVFLNGEDVDDARLQDVSAIGNYTGVLVLDADGIVFQRLTASGNQIYGLFIGGSADGAEISQATLSGNGEEGLLVCSNCHGALVVRSIATGNELDGFAFHGHDAVVKASTANGNGGVGIRALVTASDGGGNVAHGNLIADCENVVCG